MTSIAAPLPDLREATVPAEHRGIERDRVRLLVTDRTSGEQRHARVTELTTFLRAGDLLVVNDSATLPAALRAQRTGGSDLRVHVSTRLDDRIWTAEPRGEVLLGEELHLPGGASAVAIAPVEPSRPRLWYMWFQLPLPMEQYLARYGEPIAYSHVRAPFPIETYQTIFARVPGSAEMPSAGRPFTRRVLRSLRAAGVTFATVTLHCGVASFEAPERPAAERFSVPWESAAAINAAREAGGRAIAIGTTVVRALESAAVGERIVAAKGWTDLVINEHHELRAVDGLLSGFHDSSATHQWMLRAFLSPGVLSSAYAEAAESGSLKHEFGDVHLMV